MIIDGKVEFVCDFLLKVFYLLVFKFYNLTTLNTDAVVMMAIVRNMFVPCLAIAKLPFQGNTTLGEKLHSSINCCVAYFRILTSDLFQKFFKAYVGIGFKKGIYDVVSLNGRFKALFVEVFLEEFFLVS
ncbi:MAG: hypothetical protein A3G39_01435 [Deltaproteobacteria bacterium RIFCSPLOWO2_12_FULL_43_16]|nr:MAG: hypothetical protein A2Z89_00140 [Deltaproteobacteria bacterium GWA2_43_19]OGQ60951.1 MAG: hypothetical protein A3G39_01435 [Deltaproteobacteria bacterium RIFCSPLOWO2_12_FULL_43_16]